MLANTTSQTGGESPVTTRTLALARGIAAERSRAVQIRPEDALVQVGLDSVDLVNLMLAVEAEFDIMIPPKWMSPQNFKSVAAISRMVEQVRGTVHG